VIPVDLRLYPCAFLLHRGLRVQRAPGIPHALYGRKVFQSSGRMARRRIDPCLEMPGIGDAKVRDLRLDWTKT
jgi:hypothetical protein